MAWISDDYVCENPDCNMYGQVKEIMCKREERDTHKCEGWVPGNPPERPSDYEWDGQTRAYFEPCSSLLKRKIAFPGGKHISWSTWQV